MKKHRLLKSLIIIVLIICIIFVTLIINNKKQTADVVSIGSMSELEKIYNESTYNNGDYKWKLLMYMSVLPFSSLIFFPYYFSSSIKDCSMSATNSNSSDSLYSGSSSSGIIDPSNISAQATDTSSSLSNESDYSTTNIQVENVDEADITKTDGKYIYSISEDKVIITNAEDPSNLKITSNINAKFDSDVPEDLILYDNKLVIVYQSSIDKFYKSNNSSNSNTSVEIYDISNKELPKLEKSFVLYEPYYTSRCINGKLLIISSGNLKKDSDNSIITSYKEDNSKKEIGLDNIKYIKNLKTTKQTLIGTLNLNDENKWLNVQSYLMDVKNAYVSENNIYLLDNSYLSSYNNDDNDILRKLFAIYGAKGVWGIGDYNNKYNSNTYSSGEQTMIYKFDIQDNGNVEYASKTSIEGKTINQFSIDEYKDTLRVALYESGKGTRIVTFDRNLNKIGQTEYLSKGEKMYSSRFIGNMAYLVTYKTIDPLYVIDLSNPSSPKQIGELKIPGYSSYLQPYDENHLIGIGMETKETINKDVNGKEISKTAKIVGMKMALFDVTDLNNPKQISDTVIGDSRTTSAVLENHKALLFSKEKQLLAIPVNNYSKDFEATISSSDNISVMENAYNKYDSNYISEGYLVYNINLNDGFKLKGNIVHENNNKETHYSSIATNLLRGLYIKNNLFTISESYIKVNDLDSMKELSALNIKNSIDKTSNTVNKTTNSYREVY